MIKKQEINGEMLIMESRRKIRVLYRQCGSIKGVSRRTGVVYPRPYGRSWSLKSP